jgi:small multidrug resistance pump
LHGEIIMTNPMPTPRWMTVTLIAAAIYNLAWGAFTILFPNALFDWLGADRPNYPGIWQCVGMIVGVYGIGYALAARDPARHWPIVLVGLLGKLFGPIGFIDQALIKNAFPVGFGWTILTNDLIWWLPFALILRHAYRVNRVATGPLQ